ncbi:thiaminase II/PqqC family protein [Streptoalloteichus hindustanus]|uniref:TENA/THI-4/PQQC family protein n=1 Tax=Streptoalloteichus hindustanus TaxID=2017 RepID=A0A1M5N9Y8_STRHI|nr:transcriptional regulator [Streptoalloteichus hindustanus]SHG86330.1 TENA/THI-4/PQQC family protein [Streptoalloteichus hindustanus]
MTRSARDLLETIRRDLTHDDDANRLVPLVAAGRAPLTVIGDLAAEQHHVISSDWRSFLALAARATTPEAREFFTGLAQGEGVALARLADLAAATGRDPEALDDHEPEPGCQGYPSYLAWLALNGDPDAVVLALTVNFAAWGGYCGALAQGLREHYGFDDKACGFFDFFATPAPDMEERALAIVQSALDAGKDLALSHRHARMLQGYELIFWNTLADRVV